MLESLQMPPPLFAVFPYMVTFVRVAFEEAWIPPPLFDELCAIVTLVSVGFDELPQ